MERDNGAALIPARGDDTGGGDKGPEPRLDEAIKALLYNELVCAVCQELFVEASTLECGHSFCDKCITDWLRTRLTCPTCRQPVVKPPVRSVCLDRTVEKIALALYSSAMGKDVAMGSGGAATATNAPPLATNPCFISNMYTNNCTNSNSDSNNLVGGAGDHARASLPMCARVAMATAAMKRAAACGEGNAGSAMCEPSTTKTLLQEIEERKALCSMRRDQESAARNFINSIFERANQAGVKIVHIGNVWSPREQNRFMRGIMSHEGVARVEYCRLVGLTFDFVAQASREQLEIAAANVHLSDVDGRSLDPTKLTVAMLRARFEMYIRYG